MTLQFKNVTSTPQPIIYYITKISPAVKVPALDPCDNTYAHSYMWPHSWGAIPSAVMSPVCSASSSSYWAPHGSASPPNNELHKRNWPPQHSPSSKWSSQYHFHTVLHFATNNTILSHYPYGPIKTQYFGFPLYRTLHILLCKQNTRPGIKLQIQWRQKSSRVWVPIEQLRNWTYSNRGQVAGDEINDGGWTDTSCRGSVDIETAGELWRTARQTQTESALWLAGGGSRHYSVLNQFECANYLDATNSSC